MVPGKTILFYQNDWRKQMNRFDLIIKHDLEEEDAVIGLLRGVK